MNKLYRSVWIIPFIFVIVMIAVLSARLLSDPDTGSHLKAGKWIIENRTVPSKDTFTYTSNTHDYIDVHWLFQVLVYSSFRVAGYKGLSILIVLFALVLLFLLLKHNQRRKIPLAVSVFVLGFGFLVMETRINLRPELFTFLFLTLFLLILDDYFFRRKDRLFLLPLIMLVWCNMEGLFILGLGVPGAYLLSQIIRDRKIDKKFLLWIAGTILVCLANPYFLKGLTFPFELVTRFDSANVFHEHIKELKSFTSLDKLQLKDMLFLAYLIITLVTAILTWRKRSIHEFILLSVFAYLALVSVRNIALFAVVSMPVLSVSFIDIAGNLEGKRTGYHFSGNKVYRIAGFILLLIIPAGITLRLLTGSFYAANNQYTRTGLGLDSRQMPEKAADFLVRNNLTGRIINGISLGGWLEWRLPQPVFIDGRLEVVGENLYQEITESWTGGLGQLADKYRADLIVYNYVKYFPWTVQLDNMKDWHLIYLDGLNAIYARNNYAGIFREADDDFICSSYQVYDSWDEASAMCILKSKPPATLMNFLDGFRIGADLHQEDLLNIGSFFLQCRKYHLASLFMMKNLELTAGRNRFIYYALADIYAADGQDEKAEACFRQVLSFDPVNDHASRSLGILAFRKSNPLLVGAGEPQDRQARICFNKANDLYNKNDITSAIRLYDEAIRLFPGYFKAYNNRAIVKASVLRNYREAIEDFSQAIRLKPDYGDAWLGRGASKLESGDSDGACADLQKAVSLGNKQAEVLVRHFCTGKNVR